MLAYMLGALVATTVPTVTTTTPRTAIIAPVAKRNATPDMAAMFKMFDTSFPHSPIPIRPGSRLRGPRSRR